MEKRLSKGLILVLSLSALLLIIFSGVGLVRFVKGIVEGTTSTVRREEYSLLGRSLGNSENAKLILENQSLREKLVNLRAIEDENKALRDQFETSSNIVTFDLLPAAIIGSPGSVINVDSPKSFIINKGEVDGVKVGSVAIYKNNLIGIVTKTSEKISNIETILSEDSSITAKIISPEGQDIVGIVKGGHGSELVLDNVLLSDKLSSSQTVLTKGDVDESGRGYPPNLILGEVVSVEREKSELFQRGKIKSYIEFGKLTDIFIIRL